MGTYKQSACFILHHFSEVFFAIVCKGKFCRKTGHEGNFIQQYLTEYIIVFVHHLQGTEKAIRKSFPIELADWSKSFWGEKEKIEGNKA